MPRFLARLLCIQALKSASKYNIASSDRFESHCLRGKETLNEKPCQTLLWHSNLLFHFTSTPDYQTVSQPYQEHSWLSAFDQGLAAIFQVCDGAVIFMTWPDVWHAMPNIACPHCILGYPVGAPSMSVLYPGVSWYDSSECSLWNLLSVHIRLKISVRFPEIILSGCPHGFSHIHTLFKDIVSVPEMFRMATPRETVKLWLMILCADIMMDSIQK